jgi:hypothetical protein
VDSLPAGAQNPFLAKLTLDLFMGPGSPGGDISSSALYSLNYVEMVENVIETAVIGEMLENGVNLLFRGHCWWRAALTFRGVRGESKAPWMTLASNGSPICS